MSVSYIYLYHLPVSNLQIYQSLKTTSWLCARRSKLLAVQEVWLADAQTRVDEPPSGPNRVLSGLVPASPPWGFHSGNYQATGDSCWHLSINRGATCFSNWRPQRWSGGGGGEGDGCRFWVRVKIKDHRLVRASRLDKLIPKKQKPREDTMLKKLLKKNEKKTHTYIHKHTNCI